MFGKISLLLFFPLPVLAYCPNIDLTNYPYNTPSTICVDYLGEYCEATCGFSSGEDVHVCVGFEASDKKGPYILTGKNCTPSSGAGGTASGATDTGGGTPSGGSASGGSTVGGISATEGGGWYMDSEGHVRPFGLTTGLGETIVKSSKKLEDQLSGLTLAVNNSSTVANGYLAEMASDWAAFKDTNSLLQSIETKTMALNGVTQDFKTSVESGFSHLSDDLDNIANSNRDSEIVSKLNTINNTVSSFMQGYAMVSQKEYQMLDSRLSALSSGSSSTPSVSGAVATDLSGVIDSVKSVQSSIKDLDGDLKGFNSSIGGDFLASHSIGEIQIWRLDSLIDAVKAGSAGAGTGSGSGDGEGSGDVVGPAVPGEPGQGKSFWKTQYPGGLQTLFSNKMDEVKATALAGLLNNFQMTGLGNGSVSTVTFDFNFGPYANFGVYKFNDYLPDLSVIIRLLQFMVIFWALIGARSDIFGG